MQIPETVRTATVVLRNMVLGANLMSLRLCRQPREMLLYVSESLFLYKTLAATQRVPQRNVFEILPSEGTEEIVLGNLAASSPGRREVWLHSISSYCTDLVSLCLLCRLLKPELVFEIGTLRGYTAYHFALNTDPGSRVITLDLPKDQPCEPKLRTTFMDRGHAEAYSVTTGYWFDGKSEAAKIECVFGDSATFDYSPYHGRVDLFFIDGAHSYEYVRSDTLHALACCHPGSVIAWHDFGRVGVNGVSRWLLEFSKDRAIYSVPGGSLAFMVVE